MGKSITFLINKSEITAGTRGASLGPEAIITTARKKENYIFGENDLQEIKDVNTYLDKSTKFPFAKRIDGLLSIYEELNIKVSSLLQKKQFPIILAADHGSAGGTIAGIKSAYPDKRIGVIWIDAHADIHTPYTTPSGNMHGMPLASVMDIDNLECQINKVDEKTIDYWNRLKNVGGITKKINPEDLVYIAVRDTESQEEAVIEKLGLKWYTVQDVRNLGIWTLVNNINTQLHQCDIIYISFDVDSMDPLLTSHGTGTPVPNGITPQEAKDLLVHLTSNPKTACVEVVEVNPCLDEKINTMAEIALDIVDSIVNVVKNR
ncbi:MULTISPECIES: arginase [Flavobacterium]|uniref:arginase n=1 Tax=Flavobacterium TaxID=237 RepID=UPI000745E14A|nr:MULTISPECIES: arginase [Flavobacterium]OXA73352.1 arginase [Flavobacterium columnare] [Flavobacterium columnare NBRC 100251 = ATCC 23463]AMA49861.1 arginase [Flavobacterium covae]AND64609.1 arginase [Flavobacterium covae]MCJ1805926.1 arginase [Flavobacterium covae]MCJ1809872.1 arginase [Flavobacterium covae]